MRRLIASEGVSSGINGGARNLEGKKRSVGVAGEEN